MGQRSCAARLCDRDAVLCNRFKSFDDSACAVVSHAMGVLNVVLLADIFVWANSRRLVTVVPKLPHVLHCNSSGKFPLGRNWMWKSAILPVPRHPWLWLCCVAHQISSFTLTGRQCRVSYLSDDVSTQLLQVTGRNLGYALYHKMLAQCVHHMVCNRIWEFA